MDSGGERQATAFKCWTDRSQSAIRFQLARFRGHQFQPEYAKRLPNHEYASGPLFLAYRRHWADAYRPTRWVQAGEDRDRSREQQR